MSTRSSQTATTGAITATSPPATTTGRAAECVPSDLRASWPNDRNGASGILYYSVNIENSGKSACQMTGYFGVSAYAPTGTLIAANDTREADLGTLGTIFLVPGAMAFFQVGFEDSNFQAGGTDCHTVVGSLHLIPPDQTSTQQVATPDPLSTGGYPPLCEQKLYVGPVSPRQQ